MSTKQTTRIERAETRYLEARAAASAAYVRYDEAQTPDDRRRFLEEVETANKVADRRYAELDRIRRDYTVRRVKHGVYEVYVAGRLVGSCAYTGSHLDDYPWDASVHKGAAGPYPHTSAQASKRESVGWILATVEASR